METIEATSSRSSSSRSLLVQAVWGSFALPACILAAWEVFRAYGPSLPESFSNSVTHLGCALAFGVALVGLVFGVLVAVSDKMEEKRGLVPFAIVGALLNLALLLVVTIGGVSWVQQQARARASLTNVHHEMQDIAQEVRERFSHPEADSITNQNPSALPILDRIQNTIQVAAREVGASESAPLRAASDYLAQLKRHSQAYEQSAAAVQSLNVNDAGSLASKEGIAPRRQVVNEFLEANTRMREFIAHAEEHVQECLRSNAVSTAIQESFMATFGKSRDRHRLLLLIRDSDQRIGDASLGLLSLYEQEWGQWKYDPETKRVLFVNEEAVTAFNRFHAALTTASQEQRTLQERLAQMGASARLGE